MSAVADLIARLVAAGTPPELAAVAVAEAFAAGASIRNSAEILRNSADETAERRRAKDRDRKRLSAETLRKSVETPQNSTSPLNLTSSPQKDSVEKEGKKVRAHKTLLSAEFQPKPSHYEAAARLGYPNPERAVAEKCEDMRVWAESKGVMRPGWDATLHGFLRRDAKTRAPNGRHDESKSVLATTDHYIDQFGGPEAARTYVPGSDKPKPPSLDFGPSPPSVRRLPAR